MPNWPYRPSRGLRALARRSAIAALVLGPCAAPSALAQSAIASKVVGSRVAAENRRLSRTLRAADDLADTTKVLARSFATMPEAALVPLAVDTLSSGRASPRDTARSVLETLSRLRSTERVLEQFNLSAPRSPQDSLALARAAARAAAEAQTTGQTNDQRWYLGGQAGVRLSGDGDLGQTIIASARAVYFVPLHPTRDLQLPIVSNLSSLASAADTTREAKAKKLLSSSEGAYLSIDPTWKPLTNAGGDLRLRFALSAGVKVNTLQDSAKQDVTLTQFRIAPTLDIEIGQRANGQPPLMLTLRPVRSQFSGAAYKRVFNESRKFTNALETFLIVPIGGGTGLLVESSVARRSAPVVRLGLFTQAAASGG